MLPLVREKQLQVLVHEKKQPKNSCAKNICAAKNCAPNNSAPKKPSNRNFGDDNVATALSLPLVRKKQPQISSYVKNGAKIIVHK